jgi:hypothetical protein
MLVSRPRGPKINQIGLDELVPEEAIICSLPERLRYIKLGLPLESVCDIKGV